MRVGLGISLAAHVAVLVGGLVSFASTRTLEAPATPSIPIEIVSVEEFTELKRGQRDGQKKPEAVTQKRPLSPERPREAPEAKNAKPEVQTAAAPPPPPPPEARPEPVRAPEPTPRPEPKPESAKAPEPKAAAVPKPVKAPEPKPEPKPVKTADAKPEPKPPAPKPKTPEPKPVAQRSNDRAPSDEKTFDPSSIAALLNKAAPPKASMTDGPTAATASAGTLEGQGAKLTASEIDALYAQLAQCWNPPAGADDPSSLVVKVRFDLNPDGSLSRPPEVVDAPTGSFGQVAAESALRAVRRCEPYALPAQKYENWRQIVINFDPRAMFGG